MTTLSTPAAQKVAGWKLVPIEPTEAMMDAAIATVEKPCFPQDLYAAMLAAAPSPESLPASGVMEALTLARTALVSSKPVMAHYEEPVARHKAAFAAVEAAIAALASGPAPEDRT